MNTKILIVGQAPPPVSQSLPYDTTMLYDWFLEIGVNKEKAQELFTFDAVYDKFPGFDSKGGHLKPNKEQMEDYWNRELKNKVENCKAILVLGNCAKEFIKEKNIKKRAVYLIHPSKRNYSLYNKNKDGIIKSLWELLEE